MKTLIIISALVLSGCTTFNHVSDADNAWVAKNDGGFNETLYYCMANKSEPMPTCFEARYLTGKPDPKP